MGVSGKISALIPETLLFKGLFISNQLEKLSDVNESLKLEKDESVSVEKERSGVAPKASLLGTGSGPEYAGRRGDGSGKGGSLLFDLLFVLFQPSTFPITGLELRGEPATGLENCD